MELTRKTPNFFLYWAAFSVNLFSINTGSIFSWSSSAIPKLTSNDTFMNPLGRPIVSSEESLIASLSTLGSIVGTLVAGIVAEKLSLKRTLIIFSTPFFFCYLIIANAQNIIYFYVTRFILGLASGSVLAVLPSYVGEISEDYNRGTVGSIFGIMISSGHLLAFVVGPLLSIQTFAYMLMVPVTLFFITFIPFIPESPYYFLSQEDTNQAKKSLRKIRVKEDIDKELLYIMETVKENGKDKASWKDITSSIQQGLGITAILSYLQPILEASGNIFPSYVASMIIGFVEMGSCIVSTLVIDRLGRKLLLHVSSVGSCISLIALGTFFILYERNWNLDSVFWLPVASLITFYSFFNFGYACIPWTICGEVFSTNVKSLCSSIASSVCLISSFLIGLFFPFLRDTFGMGGVFYCFACLGIVGSVFVALFVPETKGKSFQEIQYELSKTRKDSEIQESMISHK